MEAQISEWFKGSGGGYTTPITSEVELLPLVTNQDDWLVASFLDKSKFGIQFEFRPEDLDLIILFVNAQHRFDGFNRGYRRNNSEDLRKTRVTDWWAIDRDTPSTGNDACLTQLSFGQIADAEHYKFCFESETGWGIELRLSADDANRIVFFMESRETLRGLLQ